MERPSAVHLYPGFVLHDWIHLQLLRHKSGVSRSGDHCRRLHLRHRLLLPDKGGLHQVPGPLLCAWDRGVCDWHHFNHCAVIQIYAVAPHALRGYRGHCFHHVPGVPHTAAVGEQEALHQSRGVRVRSALPLRRHRPDLPLPAANYRRFDQIIGPDGYTTNVGQQGADKRLQKPFRGCCFFFVFFYIKPFALFSVESEKIHNALR